MVLAIRLLFDPTLLCTRHTLPLKFEHLLVQVIFLPPLIIAFVCKPPKRQQRVLLWQQTPIGLLFVLVEILKHPRRGAKPLSDPASIPTTQAMNQSKEQGCVCACLFDVVLSVSFGFCLSFFRL